jgi:hypothetical protein
MHRGFSTLTETSASKWEHMVRIPYKWILQLPSKALESHHNEGAKENLRSGQWRVSGGTSARTSISSSAID